MEKIFLGKWDNYSQNDEGRIDGLQKVIEAVNEHGKVTVSFDYVGRTRHESAARAMKAMLPEDFKTKIGYNYHFEVWK